VAQLELRRTAIDAERTEVRFRSIASSLQVGIVVHGMDAAILWTNPAARRILELTEDELTGRTAFDPAWRAVRDDGSDLPGDEHPVALALQTGQEQRGTIIGTHQTVSGDRVWLQVDAVPQYDSHGTLFQVITSFADITALKRANTDAADRAALNASILLASPLALIATDIDGTISVFNRAAEQLLGYHAEEVVGTCTPAIWHDTEEMVARAFTLSEDNGEIVEPGFAVFTSEAARGQKSEREWTYIRKDGSRVSVKLRVTAVRNSAGAICGFLGLANDISVRKEAEAALRTAKAAAESTSRAKSEFLATMSHEIRTPMNGVLGFANLLIGTTLDDEQRLFASTIKESGEALLSIINDILDFSKIEAGKLTIEELPFDVRHTVRDIARLMQATAAERGNTIVLDDATAVACETVGDPTRVRQVILNLVGNALKFTQRGRVFVRAGPVPGTETPMVRISITDTGIGISPDKQAGLFEAFTQADSSTTRGYGGTGLGLAICKRLTHLMGGEIGVDSEPGLGSTFWFTLPLYEPARSPSTSGMAETAAPAVASIAASPPLGLHVLVAEDAPVNQMLVSRLLAIYGCTHDVAADGAEAVARYEGSVYDVILMDCHMPKVDGYEATRRIRAMEATTGAHLRIPIVALTASATLDDKTHCLNAGMDDFVAKPFGPDELRAALERCSTVTATAR
jgi:PAS domain S-box-containing protein